VAGPYHGSAGRFAGGGNGLPGPSGGTLRVSEYPDVARWNGWAAHARLNAPGAGGGTAAPVRLYEGVYDGTLEEPASAAVVQHALEVDPDGTLRWVVGADTVAASDPGAWPWGDWHHLELQVALGGFEFQPVDRFVRVRVDEAEVLAAADLDTAVDVDGWVTYGRFGNLLGDGNAVAVDLDDVLWYAWPREENPPDYPPGPAWQGAKRIWTRFPTAEGIDHVATPPDPTQFVATGGANWQVNAEASPDGDTTHVRNLASPSPGITTQLDVYRTAAGPAAFAVPPPRPPPVGDAEVVPPADPAPAQLLVWWCARGVAAVPDDFYRGRGIAEVGSYDLTGGEPGSFSSDTRNSAYFRTTAYGYASQQGEAWRFDPESFAGMLGFDPDAPDDYRSVADSLQVGWYADSRVAADALRGTQIAAEFAYNPAPPPTERARTWVTWWP
jgi:hypothetical protein